MATYLIFVREGEVVDHAAMAAYQQANAASPLPAIATPLVVHGALETLEGEAADSVVVLEFPSTEEARAWYFSDSYQRRAKLRQQAAPHRCFMVEGLPQPL